MIPLRSASGVESTIDLAMYRYEDLLRRLAD
jgi:hypothetical protein